MTTIIFGGSFDPVHNGHVALMKCALEFSGADRLFMIPAGVSPFKTHRDMAGNRHRLCMCRLAAKGMDNVFVSDIEFTLSKPSYTVNTLRALKSKYPDDEFILLCSADAFLSFKEWKDYRDILSMCRILTVVRKGHNRDEVAAFVSEIGKSQMMEMPPVYISSTAIRNAVKQNDLNLLYKYLPQPVADYIMNKNLYKEQ